jgi:hypothetical protein
LNATKSGSSHAASAIRGSAEPFGIGVKAMEAAKILEMRP